MQTIDLQTSRVFRASIRWVMVILLAASFVPMPGKVVAEVSVAQRIDLPEAMLPPDFGQTTMHVYVPETGHSVSGTMLDYWRANGAASIYGNPVSEGFVAPNGYYSQAFERGIFQFNPDWTLTDNPTVRLMPTSRPALRERVSLTRADGRRSRAERRLSAWTPGSQQALRADEVTSVGGRFSDVTGFSIVGEFADWYDRHEGPFYLGEPISEPHRQRGTTVQYFENSLLILTDEGVRPATLPPNHATLFGFDTTPIDQGTMPVFSESLFLENRNPNGVNATTIPGRKRIEVSLDEQTLTAYQGDRLVLRTAVSTGVDPNDTEVGEFRIRIKYLKKDMAGVTDGRGAVTAVGEDATGGEQYFVENVPHVMFINYQAEALHGAYWHDSFGQRMSHGCINLPLDVATYLFDWAPLGTAVTVHD